MVVRQTQRFLNGWSQCGITHADIALRRPTGAWWQQLDRPLDQLPIPFARAANCQRAEIYVRPARGRLASFLFLDDLPTTAACRLIATTAGIAVHTSIPGGCQLWLALTKPIDEHRRTGLQRHLARRLNADPASISGEHFGRLPGLRNWKRGGCWVTIRATNFQSDRLDPDSFPTEDYAAQPIDSVSFTSRTGCDRSPSAQEWGWVCGALENGLHLQEIRRRLIQRAIHRRGSDTERYVDLTIRNAIASHR